MLAFYYAWYDENTWTSGTTADTPLEPYRSSDVATIERHVNQAQAAGIDALVQSWYGPQELNNQTETNFRILLDVAAGKGFRAAVAFETNGPFFPDQASVVEALRYLLGVHAQHSAYLRYQGRPVIFFWRQQRFGVEAWETIRAQVDPDHASIWIAEGTDLRYQRVFDGHYLYSVAWSSSVARTLQDWGQRVRCYAQDYGMRRFWVATVMPGYDDTRSGRAKAFAVDRRNGDYYRATWSAAIASRPDWVVITSFNEWVEGTMIEPSARYGDLYLNLTRELGAQFKESYIPETSPPALAVTSETPTPSPTPVATTLEDGPYVRAKETVRIRSGPAVTYPRIGRLTQGEQARVRARNRDATWWQIEVPRSDTLGWVNATFVELLGDAGGLPVVELPAAPRQATVETGTVTPTVTRRAVTSPATRTPQSSRTPTAEVTATVITPTLTVTATRYGITSTATRTPQSGRTPTAEATATVIVPTSTATATRYGATSTATRMPRSGRTPTAEATATVIVPTSTATATRATPSPSASGDTQSAPRHMVGTPTATVPPFITPLGASTGTPPSDAARALPIVVTPRPLMQSSSPEVTAPLPAEAVSPLPVSASEGNSVAGATTVRQPTGMLAGTIPSLLWIGSAALLVALVLLTALFFYIHSRRSDRGDGRGMP